MEMKNYILAVLKRQIKHYYSNELKQHIRPELFDQLVYHHWALKEIADRIEQSDDADPVISVVEQFCTQMDQYSVMNERTSRQFSIARDAAEWVMDLIIEKNERGKTYGHK